MTRRSFLQALGLGTVACLLPWKPKPEPVRTIVWDSLGSYNVPTGGYYSLNGGEPEYLRDGETREILGQLIKETGEFTVKWQGATLPLESLESVWRT